MNSLTEETRTLISFLNGDQFDLPISEIPNKRARNLLSLILPEKSLLIKGAKLFGLSVKGQVQLFSVKELNVDATFSENKLTSSCTIQVSFSGFTDDWQFSSFSPMLKNSILDDVVFENLIINVSSNPTQILPKDFQEVWGDPNDPEGWDSSVIQGFDFKAEILGKSISEPLKWILGFTADDTIDIAGLLAFYSNKSTPKMSDCLPKLWFKCKPDAELNILNDRVSLNLGIISLISQTNDNYTYANCFGQIGFNKPFKLGTKEVIADYFARFENLYPNTVSAGIHLGNAKHSLSFEDIGHLLGVNDLPTKGLPDTNLLDDLVLKDFRFNFDMFRKEFLGISISVSTSPSWQWQILDSVSLEKVEFVFLVGNPGSKSEYTQLTLNGVVEIGESDIATSIVVPNMDYSLGLEEGSNVDISKWLDEVLGFNLGFSEIVCDSFLLQGNRKTKNLSLNASVSSNLNFDLGSFNISLQNASIYWTSGLDESMSFSGIAKLGGIQVQISFYHTKSEFQFFGDAHNTDGWTLGGFIQDLPEEFQLGTSVGQVLDSLSFSTMSISGDTHTKDFTFYCDAKFTINGNPLDLLLNIQLTHNQGTYEKTFEGKLTIGDSIFDVVIDKTKGQEVDSLLLASYSSQDDSGISLSTLAEDLGLGIGNLGGFKVKDIAFARESETGKPTLVTASVDGGMDLTNLPLVGRYFSKGQKVQFSLQPVLVSKKGFSKDASPQVQAYIQGLGLDYNDNPKKNELYGTLTIAGQVIPLGSSANQKVGATEGENPPELNLVIPIDNQGQSLPVAQSDQISWHVLQKNFGPVHLKKIGLKFSGDKVTFLLDASLSGGGLELSLINLGMSTTVPAFSPTFSLDGIGVDYHKDDIDIGGSLLHNGNQYEGSVVIETDALTLSAIGAYATEGGHPSMFLYAVLDKSLGGPSFFFVNGLAAGFGYNRNLVSPSIDQVSNFPLVSMAMGTTGTPATPADAIEALKGWVPPQVGEEFFAIGVRFSTFKMIESFALLTVKLGKTLEVDLLGLSTMIVPTPALEPPPNPPSPLVEVQMALKATYLPSKGFFGVQAQLTSNSFVLSKSCHLTGGFALYSWLEGTHAGDFVITLGGYHPDFSVPSWYPTVPKLGFSWKLDQHLSLSGNMYYAMVPHALMAGGGLSAVFEDGSFKAWFDAGIDLLLAWKPYHYSADAHVDIGASYTFDHWGIHHTFSASVGADLSIWGPDFSGIATIEVCHIHFHISFGGGKEAPKPISWTEFHNSFLPKSEEILSIKPTKGLMREIDTLLSTSNTHAPLPETGKVYVVDPEAFELQISSSIPAHQGSVVPSDQSELNETTKKKLKLGIAPMGLSDADILDNKLEVNITSENGDKIELSVKELTQNVPTGLWGSTITPGVNDDSFIENALCGYSLSQEFTHATSTHAIPKNELEFVRTTVKDNAGWAVGFTTTKSTDKTTIADSLTKINGNRDDLFKALGFDLKSNRILHNPGETATAFTSSPPIVTIQAS